ncbi:hypothetical protein KSF_001730 [Reticulibacter mediterranei]|uniref:Uncharacterized protein n=1 Tax=Reticulibacter mediterranei TaxID=2778369 RepID=A0A8J3ICX2_9CHLR|nr:hypothetical protein [Reticulibacter mediterranei]GHO90125.1 hypothetical protein KSF_001730 [Reticulibacter mediterranei]
METMENQIRTLIRASRLSCIADEIEALLRPSIRIMCQRVDESKLALGPPS